MIYAIRDFLDDHLVSGFRLIDGSYILALEQEYDADSDTFHLLEPLELKYEVSGEGSLKPWLHTNDGEPIALKGDKILVASPTTPELKIYYHRYNLMNKLSSVMTEGEIDSILDQLFPNEVDNQGSSVLDPQFKNWRKQWDN